MSQKQRDIVSRCVVIFAALSAVSYRCRDDLYE